MKLRTFFAAIIFTITSSPTFAFIIANTGGATPASPEPEWLLIGCPIGSSCEGASEANPFTPYVTDDSGYPFIAPPDRVTWVPNDSDSKWISHKQSFAGGPPQPGSPEGYYSYRIYFDLTGLDHLAASLTFRVMSDNDIPDVVFNGLSLGGSCSSNFLSWGGPFTLNHGFVSGINSLDFVVHNGTISGENNPTGLRVQFLDASITIPEPRTIILLSIGIAGLILRDYATH